MASLFTRIVEGEIPCYRVAEDDRFLAFLDINPLTQGHTLVIPKQEIDYIFDLPEDLLGDYMRFARKVALALEQVVPCKRIGIAVIGLEVPHTHIHLVPLQTIYDIDFKKEKVKLSPEQLSDIARKIADQHSLMNP